MASLTQSELAAKLAVEGTVSAIGGTVRGQAPVKPRVVGPQERAEIGFSQDGDLLFYPLGETGVFFYSAGAFTTIWYTGPASSAGISALDAQIKRLYPQAKMSSDGAHPTDGNFMQRGYDIKLGSGKLAIVEAVYPSPRGTDQRFSVRITAMAAKN